MTDDTTPLVASSLNARPIAKVKPTLVPFLVTVVLTVAVCLALALHDNPMILAVEQTQSSLSAAEAQQAHLLGRLTFEGVISIFVGLAAWLALYWTYVRSGNPRRGAPYMIILIMAGLVGGFAAPLAIYTASHQGAAEGRGPVRAANSLNKDYAFAISRNADLVNANIAATRWIDLTWNGALTESSDFGEARSRIGRAEELSAASKAEFETLANNHRNELRTLLAELGTSSEIASQVVAQSDDQDARYRKSIQLTGDEITAFGTVVDTLEATRGKWRVENGKYAFSDAAAKAAFGAALQKYIDVAEAREALNTPPAKAP